MKKLLIIHKDSGKKMKIAWDSKDHPTEEHIDKLFNNEEDHKIKKPYDPLETTEHLRQKAVHIPMPVMNPMGQVNSPVDNRQNVGNQQNNNDGSQPNNDGDEKLDVDGSDKSDKSDEHFLKYHESLSKLHEDKDNSNHFADAIKHGKNAKVKPDDFEMDMKSANVEPRKIEVGKELLRG